VPAEERWLHSLPSEATTVGPAPAASPAHGAPLLDAPIRYGRHSRALPSDAWPHDLALHEATYGPRPSALGSDGYTLLDWLDHLRLTGRGGAHFPVATKWRAALSSGGGGTVVVNGAEGEPASVKDAALLQLRPHLVLDGLALAAETLGAREAVVWLHAGDLATQQVVSRALVERRARGDLSVSVRLATGPDLYLTGESSAIVRALSGGPALPMLARRPAAVSGVGGLPTVVHNAETLARVALLARGRTDADGTLVTVVGPRGRLVLEAEPDETLGGLITRAGASEGAFQAVLVGGYGGTWLPWHQASNTRLTEHSLRCMRVSLGAGVLVPLPVAACGLTETARLLDYLARSSARQCGPCLFGLPAIAGTLRRLASGRAGKADLRSLEVYAGEVAGRGACHHPDGAVRLAVSALATFAADVTQHLGTGPCSGSGGSPVCPVPEEK